MKKKKPTLIHQKVRFAMPPPSQLHRNKKKYQNKMKCRIWRRLKLED